MTLCSSGAADKIPDWRENLFCRSPIPTLWCLGSTFLLGLGPSQSFISCKIDMIFGWMFMRMDESPKILDSICNPTVTTIYSQVGK